MTKAGGIRRAAPPRFIAFCGDPASLRACLSWLVPSADRPERLNRVLDCTDLVIYASPETRFASLGPEGGAVLGGRREIADALSGGLSASGAAEAAQALPRGSYAAFVRLRGEVLVIRGPGGRVAVRHVHAGKVDAFFSHSRLSLAFPAPFSRTEPARQASGRDDPWTPAGLRPGEWRRLRMKGSSAGA